MKIILLENVANLGTLGDVVVVAGGYARNYLLPFGKAKRATEDNLKQFEQKRAEYEAKQNGVLASARERFDQIDGKSFSVPAKAGVDGKLFGSVTALDIVEAAKRAGVEIRKLEVKLPNGPLKTVGEFDVDILLHHDVHAVAKVNVVADESR